MVRKPAFWGAGCIAAFGAVLLPMGVPTGVVAQSDAPVQNGAPASPPRQSGPAVEKSATPAGKARVPIDQALLLVRATLLALNDANRAGNYSVFRDLASPDFQARNSSADLALVFAEMRKSNLSLFSVMLLSPQLTAAPEVDAEGHLRLAGYVPTSPQVKFDLVYESSSRQWKLSNINVSTTPAQSAKPAEPEQKPQAQAQKPAKQAPAPKSAQQR